MASATYIKLKDSKTTILTDKDYDVFGDGTVVIQYAPGHTPGHQVLFLEAEAVRTDSDRGRSLPPAPGNQHAPVSDLRI